MSKEIQVFFVLYFPHEYIRIILIPILLYEADFHKSILDMKIYRDLIYRVSITEYFFDSLF